MTPPYPPPPRRNPLWVWLLRLPLLMLMGGALLMLLLGALLLAFQLGMQERILLGMQVDGLPLGGMTRSQAAAALENQHSARLQAVYALSDGERVWQAAAAELGLSLDAAATVERAYHSSHGDTALHDLMRQAELWFTSESSAAVFTFDEAQARDWLARLAAEIDREKQDAYLTVTGMTVETHSGQPGRRLDVEASLRALSAAVLAFDEAREIRLVITETAPLERSTAAAAERIRTALSAPLELTARDSAGQPLGPWTLSPPQIHALLNVTLHHQADGTSHYAVEVSFNAFAEFLEKLAPGLLQPPLDGRFDFDPATAQLTVLSPSAVGRELDVAATIARLEEAVFLRGTRVVPMVFAYQLPRYHDKITAAELGIRELIVEASTYYTTSPRNRRTNIAVGAAKLDGIIIPPGAEFSFNHYLGDIAPENGFVEGSVIFGGSTVAGIGGGICQVSTTVFRAAFAGGFAITERNSHGYRVGYYELAGADPGLDAAIWQPDSDFRFQNNTPPHLLIETDILSAQDALQFRFYSTPHWRTEIESAIVRDIVAAPPPRFAAASDLLAGQLRQVDYAADGADVWVYRSVYDPAGELAIRDQIFTHYLPWQAVFEVAPGDSRLQNEN